MALVTLSFCLFPCDPVCVFPGESLLLILLILTSHCLYFKDISKTKPYSCDNLINRKKTLIGEIHWSQNVH